MAELTQWFPATTKPVHEGYYDTRTPWNLNAMVLYWDGKDWRASANSPPNNRICAFFRPMREWRGLATSPVVSA